MTGLKLLFSALTIFFGALGLTQVLSYDITMSAMFFFLGLSMLANAKEKMDKGARQQAMIYGGVVVIIYLVLGYNVLSRIL